jgi:pimeloyl-ACP methyl ester carboxylesterase
MPAPTAAILLLPGMSLNASIFPDLDVPALALELNTFTPDRPGMAPYLEKVDSVLRTPVWTRASRRIVVGHSFGGMLALAWLLARSAAACDVHGLVLIATTAGPMFGDVRLRVLAAAGREWRVGVRPFLALWNSALVTVGMHRLVNRGSLGTRRVDFRELRGRGDIAVGLAGWHATAWGARRGFRAAMDGFDVRDRLRELTLPAIVLHGSRDCYFREETARRLASGLPRGELRIVPGAGHVLPLTHGDAVVAATRDLLAAPDQSAPAAPAVFSSS